MPMKNVVGCWGKLNDLRYESGRTWREILKLGNDSIGQNEPFWPDCSDLLDEETYYRTGRRNYREVDFGEFVPCVYQEMIYVIPDYIVRTITLDERNLLIKHHVLRQHKHFERIRREIDAFENFECEYVRREQIPESVRLFVWQRDEGKCIQCGGRELLEFDHIIPRAGGGASTERNVQLLCMPCNRSKGKRI